MSFASEPEVVKHTRASGMPDFSAICSARSSIGGDRYNDDVCSVLAACSWIAAVTAGLLCPTMVVSTPPKKSRYFVPSTSHTQLPSPRSIEIGSA